MKAVIFISTIIYCFFLFFTCKSPDREGVLVLDLQKASPSLNYSEFVDSVSYITFSTGDTCLLGRVDRIYFDRDTIIIKGRKSDGIFVFDRKGQLVTHINSIGQGPEEYINPSMLAIDKINHIIFIADVGGSKILKFNYLGEFLAAIPFDRENQYPHDFAITNEGDFITMKSANYSNREYSGVWLSDNNYQYSKHILNDVPDGYEFENITTYYNQTHDGIYYYDMNNDFIYFIKDNKADKLYEIDLKQKFPFKIRKMGAPSFDDLKGLANIGDFAITDNWILFRYFIFFETPNPNRWVLLDRKTNTISAYKSLVNDIDSSIDFDIFLFYVDDRTVCRIMEAKPNDCDIKIQLMHLK